METLASGIAAPASADNTAQADTDNADANSVKANGDGSAPSVLEADTSGSKVKEDPVQKRINELTREKYDNARLADQRGYELERERAENARITAELAGLRKSETSQVAPDTFPTLEQYGYDEGKYQVAVAAHISKLATEQGKTAAEAALKVERERLDSESANKSWAQREAEIIKSKPDYVDKVQKAQYLPISHELQQVLKAHELGPQIALHMVENADAARAIMRLPLASQLMEVGRITAKLEAAKAPPKPLVSQAPPPVAKVDTSDTELEKAPEEMTQTQFNKWRRKFISKR